jgi:hypothetical protein
MAKQKTDREYTDAKGDLHKVFADGRTEIYHKGPHAPDQQFMEITDGADEAVNRRRFLPWTKQTVEDTLQVRDDPEETVREVDPEEIPGIDLIDNGGDIIDDADED